MPVVHFPPPPPHSIQAITTWAKCLAAKVPGVFEMWGPECHVNKARWHMTLYKYWEPADDTAAQNLATSIYGKKFGLIERYFVKNPSNQGKPQGINGGTYNWDKIV
jgi:hypothetical protein